MNTSEPHGWRIARQTWLLWCIYFFGACNYLLKSGLATFFAWRGEAGRPPTSTGASCARPRPTPLSGNSSTGDLKPARKEPRFLFSDVRSDADDCTLLCSIYLGIYFFMYLFMYLYIHTHFDIFRPLRACLTSAILPIGPNNSVDTWSRKAVDTFRLGFGPPKQSVVTLTWEALSFLKLLNKRAK